MEKIFNPDQPLILASESPRRREILSNLGFSFEMYHRKTKIEIPEFFEPGDFVISLAELKAQEPVSHYDTGVIITADTIVYCNGDALEKPKDYADAFRMIKQLQGRTHQVYTGICLTACHDGLSRSTFEVSGVTFDLMSDEEIKWYVKTGEYSDKAGAYAIQGKASLFITKIDGCFYNVVGFPIHAFYRLLRDFINVLIDA